MRKGRVSGISRLTCLLAPESRSVTLMSATTVSGRASSRTGLDSEDSTISGTLSLTSTTSMTTLQWAATAPGPLSMAWMYISYELVSS